MRLIFCELRAIPEFIQTYTFKSSTTLYGDYPLTMHHTRTRKGLTGKKLLLITFDYELFLGDRSGSVQQCLISTTDKLLACLNRYAFKAIFFVDTVYLLRLQKLAAEHRLARADLEAITNQLVRMVHDGHEIHPHLHPHWMDAIYDPKINEWCLPNKRYYTFASLSAEQRTELFDQSVEMIRSLLIAAKQTQPVDSYRAGGWSIQSFENFRQHFQKHGIMHEFSVIPGRFLYSDAHHFDFRNAPADLPVYHFSDDVCVNDEMGDFTEWTISSYPRTKFQQWIDFKINGMLQRLHITGKIAGSTIMFQVEKEGDLYSVGTVPRLVASFEGLNPYRVMRYLQLIKKADYFHFISHPKLINGFEIKMIDLLFRSLSRGAGVDTDFRKHVKID